MVENILIDNPSIGVSLELDKVKTPWFILDYINWGTIDADQSTNKYVGQHGESLVSNQLGTRDIEISGWVIARSNEDMSSRKRFLNKFVNPLQSMIITYNGFSLEFYPSTTIEYSDDSSDNNEVVCQFMIEGEAFDPVFKDARQNTANAAQTNGMCHFPLVIPLQPDPPAGVVFGLIETSLTMEVVNDGAIDTGIIIKFTARGAVTNPRITNVDTQEYFCINKTLEAGEVVTINTNIGSKSVKGYIDGIESNYFMYRDFGSSWLQLGLGSNLFVRSADANVENLEVSIEFFNRYLEVQECF